MPVRDKVYDKLKSMGLTDSKEEFFNYYDNDENVRKQVYQDLKSDGLTDSEEEFYEYMKPSIANETSHGSNSPTTGGVGTQEEADSIFDANMRKFQEGKPIERVSVGKNDDTQGSYQYKPEVQKHILENKPDIFKPKTVDMYGAHNKDKNEMDLMSEGRLYGMKSMRAMSTIEEQLDERIKANKEALKEAYAKRNERKKSERGNFLERLKEVQSNYRMEVPGSINLSALQKDEEIANLIAERDYLEESKEVFDAAKNDAGFFQGMKDAVDASWITFGVSDLHNAERIANVQKKIESGQELSESEQSLITSLGLQQIVNEQYNELLGRWYKAGMTTADMVPFMAEMAVSPLSGLGKTAMKASIKKFGEKGAKAIASKILSRTIGDVAGAAGMAVTTGMPSVMANALERQQGYVTTDVTSGSVEGLGFEGGENASDAWRKAITSRTIENWSEMVGQYFSPVGNVLGKGIKKGFSKMGLGKINEFLDNINSFNLAKVLDDFTEQTQWNGSLGEFAEEQVGMIADALLVGDTKWSDITDLDQQLDVALGVGVFGTFMSLLRIGGYRTPKYRARKAVEKADENGLNLFGLDWKNVKELILASPDEELSANLAAHTEFSDEQMKAAFMYANALKAQQAVNTYKEKEKIDKPSDVGVETESAYDEGFETTESYLKHYAKRELDFAESELGVNSRNSDEQQFAQMVMAGADSPVETINAMAEQGYSDEQIQKAKDYYTAYHRMNGIADALIEDIDSQIEKVNNEVDANTNQDNGSVTRVVLRDGGVGHVVEGTVVRAEDGTVDVNNSDDVIYVRLENGEIKMMNPNKDLVGVAWMDSPERLKEYNNTILKQDLLDKAIGEIDWNPATPNPKVGDSFEMNGVPVVVAGMNENGLVVVSAEEWQKAQGKKDYAFQTQLIVPVSAYKDWASAQLDSQEEAANAQQESAITSGPVIEEVNTEVNNPVVEEVAQPQAEVQPVVEEAPVIPTKEDGSIDFVSYGKEGTFKTLGEKYGEKMPHKIEVTSKALAEDLKKAQQKLDKAEEDYDNAPIGREDKAEKAFNKAREEFEAVKREADFWAEMDADVKKAQEQRESIVNPQIEAETSNEPMTADEFVAQQLANGNITLESNSYKKETGFGEEERNKFIKMFRTLENGGMTIERAGEMLMQMDRENGTNFFDQNDPNAGRDALISFLGSVSSWGDIAGYIRNAREAQAAKESEGLRSEMEDFVQENFHMTLEEYATLEETILQNNPYEGVNLAQIDAIFAEAELERQQLNKEQYESGTITEGNQGQSELLSEERIDNSTGNQPSQAVGETEGTGRNIKVENRTSQESTSRSELTSQIEKARTEVNGNPTEAQKEAGNYKKGHVKIDGYDITIENPKGGVRSGTDKNGKKWSITMNNDYGYIRGTEAVDGDHIDVFLSDNPTEGNVFVVDQSNEDGSFDESKVMYGFDSLEEARAAYLSNYEKGWESRIMAITEVSKDEFKKWIDSSHRKTKAFSEYKSVKAEAGQGYSIEASNVSRMEDIEARITEIENERIEIEGELENLGNSNPLASAELISQLDQLDREQSELEAEYSGLRSMNDESNAILEEEGSNLRFRGQQAKEEKRRKPLRERAKEWSKKLGVKVKIMESLKDVTNVSARRAIIMGEIVTGWYEESTGEVCLYMPYLSSESEVDATYIHEVVAHKGLRGLLGDKFDEFCDQVWGMMSAADKAKFIKYPGVNGNTRAAADEYIAHLAETIDVSDSSWSKFTELIKKFLKAIGLEPKMTNADIANAIKRSYQRLAESGNAENVGGEDTRFRTLEEINQTFNEELQQQIDGTLPNGHIYQLGSPSAALLSTGIADVPIELNSTRLEDKSKNFGHDYDLSELKDLVKAIHNPMAIFAYGDKNKSQNIIVEIQHEGKNFIVGLSIRPSVGGRILDINSIRNVFPKDNAEWLNWISQGKMLYADKERIQGLINQQRTNLADVDYLDLDSIANIINSFENPTLPEEKTLFRTVYHGSAASFDKFDHSFISTGEGNQSYGWGTYVTEAEGVGVRYANAAQRNNINWNLMDAEDNVREDERYIRDTQKELDEVNSITKFENPSQKARVLYLREKLSNKLAEYKDQLAKDKAELEKWGKMANEKGGRHLYQVDIPDNNGSNYLSYKTDNSQEVIDKVNNAYRNLLLQRGVEEEDINPDFAPFGRGVSGETIYNTFSRELGGDKAASEFLNRNGFIGIVYPVNEKKGGNASNENNYVIFNEHDLNIVEHTRFRAVTDKKLIDKLESEPKMKVYRAMQVVNGKLYPPMSAKVDGKLREPIELGKWEEAEERPDLADSKGYFKLDKGNKTSLKARYNPYIHTSTTPLNDQFSSAQDRPELVTVEVEIPESELTSGYKAEKAKDSVGKLEWKAGVVQGKLSGTRTVILSRWDKPIRIVPDSEVADEIVKMFGDKKITMPSNVVTPSLRSELEKRGVPFVETDNQGKEIGGTRFRISPEMDAEYLEAVNSGDMEKAQKMVNEAAKMSMPNTKVVDEKGDPLVVYHGTGKKFYTFKSPNKRFYGSPDAYFFTDDKVIGEDYSNGYLIPAFLNIENPKTVDFKGSSWSGEIFENGKHVGSLGSSDSHVKKAHEEGYDGAILKNIKDAISGELADRISTDYVAFEPSQIKSAEPVTYDDNGNVIPLSERFNSESNDIRFRTAYHGSAAEFDKSSKDFIGSGEGLSVMGHGFYVTTYEGTSEYYANVASENKRKIIQEGGYTFNGEVVRDRALVSAYELLKENNFDADKAIERANHRIEIFKKRKGIFANTSTTEKAIEYLEAEKNNPGSIGYQEEIVEKPSRVKYEVEIPDDTGKNYLDLDKKATKKFKDESKKRMIEILDNGEEASYWKKNRDIINYEWESVDKNDATNDTVRGTMEQFISQEEVANIFSEMGYVGSKAKASDGTTYIIYNEDDIEIKGSTRFRIANQNQEIFVSNAQKAVEGIKQEKATPGQWLAMIEKNGGIKAGEDKWLGLSDWLKGSDKKSLTKDEILDFIGENKIRIEEVHYGKAMFSPNSIVNLESDIKRGISRGNSIEDVLKSWDDEFNDNKFDSYKKGLFTVDENGSIKVEGGLSFPINNTRIHYTTEGLENKHEIALTVPTIESWNESDEIHFGDAGEGRAVAWIRFGETFVMEDDSYIRKVTELKEPYRDVNGHDIYKTDSGSQNDFIVHGKGRNGEMIYVAYVNGNQIPVPHKTLEDAMDEMNKYFKEHPIKDRKRRNVLVIDEIQSNRHQEGREKGYKSEEVRKNYTYEEVDTIYGKQMVLSLNGTTSFYPIGTTIEEAIRDYEENPMTAMTIDKRFPNAPFEKNWHELAMKRMLRYAAENGYDKVAWTTGTQQAKRYNLSKFVDDIRCNRVGKNGNKSFVLEGIDYNVVANNEGLVVAGVDEFKSKHLSEIVGSSLADKMLGMEEGDVLNNADLRIGGEGMKGFYDKMLPSFVNKYVKKWGTKVQDIELPNVESAGRIMHSVDVTDSMKESVMEGQTMFRIRDNKKQQEIDSDYVNAVREGDFGKAIGLFREYVLSKAKDNGVIPVDYGVGYRSHSHSSIAKKVKEENPDAISEAAYQMSKRVSKGSILVPMPSRSGKATYTIKLAEAIAKATDSVVRDVLRGKERMSVYEAKKKGLKIDSRDLGFYITEKLPKDKNIIIVDNVIDRGITALAAVEAVEGGSVLAYAFTEGPKDRVIPLKLSDPITYDDELRIIPLSKRFNSATNDLRFRTVNEPAISYATQSEAEDVVDVPTNEVKYTMNNIGTELYKVSGNYMRYLYMNGTLGRVLRGEFAEIDQIKAKSEYDHAKDILGDYLDELVRMKHQATEPAQDVINDVIRDIEYSLDYYRDLALGKDVWRTKQSPRFRIVEKHRDNVQEEISRFTSKYKSASVRLFHQNTSDKEIQEWTGIKNATAKELMEFFDVQKMPASFVSSTGKIIIFADKVNSKKIEKTLFHENLHNQLNHGLHNGLLYKFYESAKSDEKFSKWKNISDKYQESERHEEFFAYVVSNKMEEGNLDDVLEHLSSEEQNELFNILNSIGYEYEQERNRRTSQAGRRSGRYSMRNSNAQPVDRRETEGAGSQEENRRGRSKEQAERIKNLFDQVADMGLDGVLGNEAYNSTMIKMYGALPEESRKEVMADAVSNYNGDYVPAMHDYLIKAKENIVDKIVGAIRSALRKVGFDVDINSSDVKYLLWRSKKPLNRNNIFDVAEDIDAKRRMSVKDGSTSSTRFRVADKSELQLMAQDALDKYNDIERGYGSELEVAERLRESLEQYEGSENTSQLEEILDTYESDFEDSYSRWGRRMEDGSEEFIEALEAFATRSNGTRFSIKNFDPSDKRDALIKEYDSYLKTGKFNFIEAFQDRMYSLKVLMDKIVNATGKKVRDFEDAYTAENQLGSINKPMQEKYLDKFYKPLLEEIKKLSEKYGRDVVERYIYCKSGLERNEVLRQRDADEAYNDAKAELDEKLTNGSINQAQYNSLLAKIDAERQKTLSEDVDYSGIRGMLYNVKAQAINADYESGKIDKATKDQQLAKLEANKKDEVKDWKDFAEKQVAALEGKASTKELDALWNKINAATNETLRMDYESGMIDKETYDAEKNMMKYYVPLRNWEDTTAEEMYEYRSELVRPVSSNQKRAKGRESQADNPIATIGLMAQNAIVRGNRNKVKQKFYAFVANRETSLATVRDAWYVKDAQGNWVAEYADTSKAKNSAEFEAIIDQFEEDMKLLEEQGMAFKSKLPIGMKFKASGRQKQAHVVPVMINGKEYAVYVNGNPRAAQAMNGETNSEAAKNSFFGIWDRLNRIYSAGLTSWNPDFIIPNMVRDGIHATTMTFIDAGPIAAAKFALNGPRAFAQVFAMISGKGKSLVNPKYQAYFEEFIANGGETGYTAIRTLEDYKKEYDKLINKAKGVKASNWAKDGFSAVGGLIETANRIFEDVNRFNAYVSARESGESIMRSVNAAKNITVNFNRKGAGFANNSVWGSVAGWMSRHALFFNPSIQGIEQLITKSKANPKRAKTITATILSSGFLMPMINELLVSALGGDDEDDYWNQSDYKRRNNWILFTGNGYVTIPLPPVLRELYGMGDILYGAITGHITPERAVMDVARQVQSAIGFFNLIPEASQEPDMITYAKGFSADIITPFLDVLTNTNFMGRPIAKWTDYNKYDPEYERVYKGVSKQWVEVSKFLNELGGNEGRRSDVWGNFINPAMMEHLITSYGGGIGKTINNLAGMVIDIAEGDTENLDPFRKSPIVPRFYTPVDEKSAVPGINRRYYDYDYRYNVAKKALKNYQEGVASGEHPEYQKYIDEMKKNGEIRFINYFKSNSKQIKDIQNRIKGNPKNKKELEKDLIEMKAKVSVKCDEILK